MSAWEYILKITLLAFLGAGAFFDIKSKSIPVWYPAAGFAAGIILKLLEGSFNIFQIAGGCAVGLLLLMLSLISKNAIGKGDGLMFIVTGVFVGLIGNVILLFVSLLKAAITSLVMLLTKRIKKKNLIPFVPFMLAGYDVLLLVNI